MWLNFLFRKKSKEKNTLENGKFTLEKL